MGFLQLILATLLALIFAVSDHFGLKQEFPISAKGVFAIFIPVLGAGFEIGLEIAYCFVSLPEGPFLEQIVESCEFCVLVLLELILHNCLANS